MSEYLTIVDKNDFELGKKLRELVHQDGDIHRVSHIWVFNSKGELLCHKRSSTKDVMPNKWDIVVGGHVESGSSYEDTAISELKDEYGIIVNTNNLIPIYKIRFDVDAQNGSCKKFIKGFVLKFDRDIGSLKFNSGEVDVVKFIKISDLEKIMNDKIRQKEFFAPDYFFKVIDKVKTLF